MWMLNEHPHTHQVPHVGFPQIDPVKRVSKTKLIPIGAADFIIMPEIFALQITLIKPQKAMNIKIDSPIITERNMNIHDPEYISLFVVRRAKNQTQ